MQTIESERRPLTNSFRQTVQIQMEHPEKIIHYETNKRAKAIPCGGTEPTLLTSEQE